MEAVKIVLLCVALSIAYGIVQDQVTVRVCLEYFTVGHPPVFDTQDPTLLALGWGVIATWWMGAILGIAVAIGARAGANPPLPARALLRPLAVLLATMAGASLVAGFAGHEASERGWVVLLPPLDAWVPAARHSRYLADLWAHSAAYGVGGIGGIVVAVLAWRRRRDRAPLARPLDPDPVATTSPDSVAP